MQAPNSEPQFPHLYKQVTGLHMLAKEANEIRCIQARGGPTVPKVWSEDTRGVPETLPSERV